MAERTIEMDRAEILTQAEQKFIKTSEFCLLQVHLWRIKPETKGKSKKFFDKDKDKDRDKFKHDIERKKQQVSLTMREVSEQVKHKKKEGPKVTEPENGNRKNYFRRCSGVTVPITVAGLN